MKFCVSLFEADMVHLYENLYLLFISSLINRVIRDTECMKEMFDKMVEPVMFLTFVLKHKIVGEPLFQKRYGNGILFVQVLL